jgi:hypothetical protein
MRCLENAACVFGSVSKHFYEAARHVPTTTRWQLLPLALCTLPTMVLAGLLMICS